MSSALPPQQGKPRWNAISIALFVIGLLILVPSGLCTALIGVPFAFGGFAAGDAQMIVNGTECINGIWCVFIERCTKFIQIDIRADLITHLFIELDIECAR
jgi:hypothetical protein